jgi:phthiodiolone/phenolphthiodiolone dimycocerosates ketoreductase
VDWSTPVARFEEAMATIRALWNSDGELVTRDSPFFALRDAVFDLPPYRGKWPEIWIAAHGPRMLRATGRYAGAWFPVLAIAPKNYGASLQVVRDAAADAGRDPMSVTAATGLFVVTGHTPAEVDEALGSDIMKAFALNFPAEVWARHGASHPLGDDFTGLQDIIPQTLDEPTVLSHVSDVPASLLRECLLVGTPDEVIDQAAEWRDHGLQYLVTQHQCCAAERATWSGRIRAVHENPSPASQAVTDPSQPKKHHHR